MLGPETEEMLDINLTASNDELSSPSLLSPQRPDSRSGVHAKILDRMREGKFFFSIEVFPPRTASGASNLLAKLDSFKQGGALFCNITWHPAGNPAGDDDTSSITVAAVASNYCGIETVLHVTCIGQTQQSLLDVLNKAKRLGIRNIFALRGGYPQGHPDSNSYQQDLLYLKEKVDAGADYIITQLFFKVEDFLKFFDDCRAIGIMIPIIPGLFPIQAYASLHQLAKLARIEIPPSIVSQVEELKDNDEAIREYGCRMAVDMCRELLHSGIVPGIHFYTLNREFATREITKLLNLWLASPSVRQLPWKTSGNYRREQEDVRPIFWNLRPKSYIHRTSEWDEFPNGRWGNSAAPSFRDIEDHHLYYLRGSGNKREILAMYGEELNSLDDVQDVFVSFVTGQPKPNGVQVTSIPWSEDSLQPESSIIMADLSFVNRNGFLTINSQPSVNGLPSEDHLVGWGGPGGYIYQKAYLEFFTCLENVNILRSVLPLYPKVSYHIVDQKGKINLCNSTSRCPAAVTWGIFPGQEVIQPTVVDPVSFNIWKDEAFALWHEHWGQFYSPDSKSRHIIDSIQDSFCLINLVDNDFVKPTVLFDILKEVVKRNSRSGFQENIRPHCVS